MTHFHAVRRALLAALALFGLSATAHAAAAISHTINYQGFLTDTATGLPIDTGKDMQFAIYSAATGGTLLFTESRCGSGNARVTVSKGRYQVELGSTTASGIPASVFTGNANAWLEVRVDPDNNCAGFETLTPRVRLQSAPYAFQAAYAATATAVAGGYADIGYAADPAVTEPLRVTHVGSDNTLQNSVRIYRAGSGGVPSQANIGSRFYFEMPNDSGTDQQVAAVSAILTDPVAGQEKGALTFETLDGAQGGPIEWMRIDETGDVGIGTTDPQSRLHVSNGDIRISTTAGSRGIIYQDGSTQTRAPIENLATTGALTFAFNGTASCGGQGTEPQGAMGAVNFARNRTNSRVRVHASGGILEGTGAATSYCFDLCVNTTGATPCPCGAAAVAWTGDYVGGGLQGGFSMTALVTPAVTANPVDVWLCAGESGALAGSTVPNFEIVVSEEP